MMKNIIKCCLVCSVLISNIFVYPCCCCKKKSPKPEDGQKYIEYVLGITSADIIFSFSFDFQLENDGKTKKCVSFPPYKSQDELETEYSRRFTKKDDLKGCRSYWLLKSIKKNKYLTFSCSVYFVRRGKGNVNSSQLLEKYSGDIVDFLANISFYKLIEFKYDELTDYNYSFGSSVGFKTETFRDIIDLYNRAVNDPTIKDDSNYTGYPYVKAELEKRIKDGIYKCK